MASPEQRAAVRCRRSIRRTSVDGLDPALAPRRAAWSIAAASPRQRERQVPERAAADVVDAAVDELEARRPPPTISAKTCACETSPSRKDSVTRRPGCRSRRPPTARGRGHRRRRASTRSGAWPVCCGVGEHVEHRALLDDAARLHHGDLVGDRPDDVHLVRDDDDRDAELLVDPRSSASTSRVVSGSSALVASSASRMRGRGRERAGDADALLLAAGELLGIGVRLVGEPDEVQQLGDAGRAARPSRHAGDLQRVGDVAVRRCASEEVELLEDHADAAADRAQLALGQRRDLGAVDRRSLPASAARGR